MRPVTHEELSQPYRRGFRNVSNFEVEETLDTTLSRLFGFNSVSEPQNSASDMT